MADWVLPGALVLPVHAKGWEPRALREADRFVTDDWAQFSKSLGEPGGFYHPLPELHAQLGEIVTGRRPGREGPAETIFCVNYGMAIHDVAMAAQTLERPAAGGWAGRCRCSTGSSRSRESRREARSERRAGGSATSAPTSSTRPGGREVREATGDKGSVWVCGFAGV